jgi:hypothetical protein
MAAHARMAFGECSGQDSQASYLDEQEGCLHFDDGYKIDLAQRNLGLSLERITKLHGIDTKESTLEGPTPEDTSQVLYSALHNPELTKCLYPEGVRLQKLGTVQKAQNKSFNPSESNLRLSVDQIPGEQWTNRTFEAWYKSLKGNWLEIYMANQTRSLVPQIELSQGVYGTLPSGRPIEVDVAVVRGHRFYLISCTTDSGLGLCKSKLFEVALRARQLGGDLARSALVCLLNGSDSRGSYADQLRQDVESVWDAPNTPLVFGAADLKGMDRATRHCKP